MITLSVQFKIRLTESPLFSEQTSPVKPVRKRCMIYNVSQILYTVHMFHFVCRLTFSCFPVFSCCPLNSRNNVTQGLSYSFTSPVFQRFLKRKPTLRSVSSWKPSCSSLWMHTHPSFMWHSLRDGESSTQVWESAFKCHCTVIITHFQKV